MTIFVGHGRMPEIQLPLSEPIKTLEEPYPMFHISIGFGKLPWERVLTSQNKTIKILLFPNFFAEQVGHHRVVFKQDGSRFI